MQKQFAYHNWKRVWKLKSLNAFRWYVVLKNVQCSYGFQMCVQYIYWLEVNMKCKFIIMQHDCMRAHMMCTIYGSESIKILQYTKRQTITIRANSIVLERCGKKSHKIIPVTKWFSDLIQFTHFKSLNSNWNLCQ